LIAGNRGQRFGKLSKRRTFDYDESPIDINFEMGNPISGGIPWIAYSELEVQTILKIHFETLEFDVNWRHYDDPANEKGVDLECSRPSDNQEVLIAVKKKPKKEALAQLVELVDHPATKRIYVSIGGAAQSFLDNSRKFEAQIEFWDEQKLEDHLNESGLTLRLKVANSQANDAMFRIMKNLMRIIKSKPAKGSLPGKPSSEIMETLWGMKDRAVTVYKCAAMMQLMFEDSSRFGDLTDEQVQNLVLYVLDYVYVKGLLSICTVFEDLSPELQELLSHVHMVTKIRSNWHELYTYHRDLVPGAIDVVYRDYAEEKAKWKAVAASLKAGSKDAGLLSDENRRLDDATGVFRRLGTWAHGLEGTIDDLYTLCVRGYVEP
jgi:hypothetical protein